MRLSTSSCISNTLSGPRSGLPQSFSTLLSFFADGCPLVVVHRRTDRHTYMHIDVLFDTELHMALRTECASGRGSVCY